MTPEKSVEMNMSRAIKEDLLSKLRFRYAQRGREAKSLMLDELCEDYDYERKYAIKLLTDKVPAPTGRPKPGPEPQYSTIEPIVRTIWLAAEQPCGKRLKPALALWLPHYQKRYEKLSKRQRQLLLKISPSTLDRLLAPAMAAYPGHGLSGTRPGSLLRTEIPVRTDNWDLTQPGFLEADTVAHCGGSLAGSFVWSVTFTDIVSGWTEGRAVWNKGATGVLAATEDVEKSLPFELLGFDSDNGSEFLNHHLWAYFRERKAQVKFTRSRAYHKNDNAHIEQKNWMWPRQLLGYGRLEDPSLVEPITRLYKEAWGPLQNFFLPSLKLDSKWRDGSHWRKNYEPASTACQKLLASPTLTSKQRQTLRDQYESLDPFALKAEVEKQLKPILKQAAISPSPAPLAAPFPPGAAKGAGPQNPCSERKD